MWLMCWSRGRSAISKAAPRAWAVVTAPWTWRKKHRDERFKLTLNVLQATQVVVDEAEIDHTLNQLKR